MTCHENDSTMSGSEPPRDGQEGGQGDGGRHSDCQVMETGHVT